MSFSGRTPEALLPRSDSKNPATTCKGLTASGRPCRRALATSNNASPVSSPSRGGHGVLAVLNGTEAAAFYCWQHKDQAQQLAAHPEQKTTVIPLKQRSSLDSLADKVGIIDLESEGFTDSRRRQGRRHHNDESRLAKRDILPSGWHNMQGPLMTVPEEYMPVRPVKRQDYVQIRQKKQSSWVCCCFGGDSDDEPVAKARLTPRRLSGGYQTPTPMLATARPPTEVRRKPVPVPVQMPMSQKNNTNTGTIRPSGPSSTSSGSHTLELLSLIPDHMSPQTTSLLLSELSKPISKFDEAGYIYIFWLTPEDAAARPDDETASSLLTDSESEDEVLPTSIQDKRGAVGSQAHQRRQSEALRRYASVRRPSTSTAAPKRTILLKIGRAANVHRRMTQWTKQCGQDITLVRYYPHQTTIKPTSASSDRAARQCPYIHRVERLIHIELAEQKLQSEACATCGREHKEWFEIEATRKGLRAVDEAIRRWVNWAQTLDRAAVTQKATDRPAIAARQPFTVGDIRPPEPAGRRTPVEGYY